MEAETTFHPCRLREQFCGVCEAVHGNCGDIRMIFQVLNLAERNIRLLQIGADRRRVRTGLRRTPRPF